MTRERQVNWFLCFERLFVLLVRWWKAGRWWVKGRISLKECQPTGPDLALEVLDVDQLVLSLCEVAKLRILIVRGRHE